MGAIIGRTGGGVNGANRLGDRRFGRGATICPRDEVVFMLVIEKMCKAFTVVSPHKDNFGDPRRSKWAFGMARRCGGGNGPKQGGGISNVQ